MDTLKIPLEYGRDGFVHVTDDTDDYYKQMIESAWQYPDNDNETDLLNKLLIFFTLKSDLDSRNSTRIKKNLSRNYWDTFKNLVLDILLLTSGPILYINLKFQLRGNSFILILRLLIKTIQALLTMQSSKLIACNDIY